MVNINDFFKDACTVKRSTGTTNDQGVETFSDVLACACTLQIGNSGDSAYRGSNWKFGSVVIMPYTTTAFQVNDVVTITTATGRVISGTIENYDSYDWSGIQGTVIWLKQATDE